MTLVLTDIPELGSSSLQAIPLDLLTEETLRDLSWLLGDDFDPTCYTSLMVLPPVLLMFVDSQEQLVA